MKLLIASDIHGAAGYCRDLLAAWDREGADRLLLLGDLLYHGPRNDLPPDYAPKVVIALLNARKVAGQGGRGHIAEPLFCPFEVMQWLVDPNRRKGLPIQAATAWRMLKNHFPKVHAQYEVGDPNTD